MSTQPVDQILEPTGQLLARSLAALARVRGGKPFHPRGMVYEATLSVDGRAPRLVGESLLGRPDRHRAIVRFSRSAGFPPALPDAFGMAIRLPDVHGEGRHQDFLLVTSVDRPILHHLLVPVTDAQQTVYSSLLPYTAGNRVFLIGARPSPESPRPAGRTADERLERAASTGDLRFALTVARMSRRFTAIGELRVGARLPDIADSIAFDPWNTGGNVAPAGALNRLRRPAYRRAQATRRRLEAGTR